MQRLKLWQAIVQTALAALPLAGSILNWIPGGPRVWSRWLAWTRPRPSTLHLIDVLARGGHPALGLAVAEAHILYLLDHPEWRASRISRLRSGARKRLSQPVVLEVIPADEKAAVLAELVALFEARGARPFLCFGTLLGKVRHDDFMDRELDLDLGFFYPETRSEDVREALVSAGYTITVWEPDPWPCRVKALKPGSRLIVDVVFFKADGPFRLTYTPCLNRTLIRQRRGFDLERTTLRGVEVWMPTDAEVHLEENYGAWRVPSTYHHHILTSRLTDFTLPEVRYLLTSMLLNALVRGQDHEADALIGIGEEHYEEDLWQRLSKHRNHRA